MSELPSEDVLGNDAVAGTDNADDIDLDGVFEDGFDFEESDLLAITGEADSNNNSESKLGKAALDESSLDRKYLDADTLAQYNHLGPDGAPSNVSKVGPSDEGVKSEGSDEDDEDEDDEVSLASDEEGEGKSAPTNGAAANGAAGEEDEDEDDEDDGGDDAGGEEKKGGDGGKKRARKRLGQVSNFEPCWLISAPCSLKPH